MRELLLSKGFKFNDFEYNTGNFYEYYGTNGDEKTKRLATLFGFNNDGTDEDLVICCDERLTEFEACCYGGHIEYTRDEFEQLVNRM